MRIKKMSQKTYEDLVRDAKIHAQENNLPEIKNGTQKQIDFAYKIRHEFLSPWNIGSTISEIDAAEKFIVADTYDNKIPAEIMGKWIAEIKKYFISNDAKFWLKEWDNREIDKPEHRYGTQSIIQKFSNLKTYFTYKIRKYLSEKKS